METAQLLPAERQASSKKKCKLTILAIVIVALLLTGVIVLIWWFELRSSDDEASDAFDFDRDWFEDVILSKNIDSTGLEHGFLYKSLILYEPEEGLYRTQFDQYWDYNGPDVNETNIHSASTLTAQSRIINNFAFAFQQTNEPEFLMAMYQGLDVLFNEFSDNVYGGYYEQIVKYRNGTYQVTNSDKSSYHLAFAIKALSKVYEVTLNTTVLEKATAIYHLLQNNFTDFTGTGIYQVMNEDMTEIVEETKSDNNMLHWFHCLGKLYKAYSIYYEEQNVTEIADDMLSLQIIADSINDVYDLLMSVRVRGNFTYNDPGNDELVEKEYLVLPRSYYGNWTAYQPIQSNVDWGHNFEYSLFIWEYIELGVINDNDTNVWNTENIFNGCMDIGYNKSKGYIPSRGGAPGGSWWEQIEALRTMIYYYYKCPCKYDGGDNRLKQDINNLLNMYKEYYYDLEYGGVYWNPWNNEFNKGTVWKIGYHLVESCFDVLEWSM